MEDQSIRIVRALLPDEWVVREYRPDYGIDLTVELFEYLDERQTVAATLGETLFVQVKSTHVIRPRKLRVYGRDNVEKGPLTEDLTESIEIDAIDLRLDTSELSTVQAMGSAIPVMLFLVEISTRRIYFVCLNDLLEKVILPEDPVFGDQRTKTIHIPLRNRITAESAVSVLPLATFAKRPKLYSAFEKFSYQRHELGYAVPLVTSAASTQHLYEGLAGLTSLVRHFLTVDLRYDFWGRMPEWKPIEWSFREISRLAEFLSADALLDSGALREYLATPFPFGALKSDFLDRLDLVDLQRTFATHVDIIWERLANLSRIYEEVAREWFLPTYLSHALTEDLTPG